MPVKVRRVNPELFVRRCVACGYDGALLKGGLAARCARCGCDLKARPPRSYAEMEGFIGQPITLDSPPGPELTHQSLIQRWLAFLFIVMLGFTVMAFLFASAIP